MQLITRVRKNLKHKEVTSVIKQVEDDMEDVTGNRMAIVKKNLIIDQNLCKIKGTISIYAYDQC